VEASWEKCALPASTCRREKPSFAWRVAHRSSPKSAPQFQVPSFKFQVPPNPQSLTPNLQAEAEAEGYFLKAIEIARKQQAKSWELRATTSLTRLWQQQGKQAEARQMLADVYNWFTEGFDTKDLQEAKELLESLRECSES
jgi:hypothetical protein